MAALPFPGVSSAVAHPLTNTIELFSNGRSAGTIQCRDQKTFMGFIPARESFANFVAELRNAQVVVEIRVPLVAAMAALRLGS